MAIAYLGSAADRLHPSAPSPSEGLAAGPRFSLPQRPAHVFSIDLLAVANQFAESAATIPEMQNLVERTWVLMAVNDLFEVWAIGWPPGGQIELHDHGPSSGAVVVATGELVESTIRPTAHGVTLIENHQIKVGQHRTFGPRYIHDICNTSEQNAVSVHVYGPRLTTMAYYQLSKRGCLEVVRVEEAEPLGPFDTTSAHDPS